MINQMKMNLYIIRVSKNNKFSTTIIKTFTGKKADRLYKILTEQKRNK